MKSIIVAAIALVGFTAAAPPSYRQYPRHYPAHLARDAAYSAETVIPYYKTVKEYVPRAAAPEPLFTVLDRVFDTTTVPKREAKPMPKYKQYKAPKYGSRKKRQDLPAVPGVPAVPEVSSLPVVNTRQVPDVSEVSDVESELPVVNTRQVPDVSEVSDLESELPTSSVPEVGSVA